MTQPLVTLGVPRSPGPPARPLVRTTELDRYFDYCLQPYPPRGPTEGKLRGESLLWNSFDVAGAPPDLDDAVRAIQSACGRDMTVFGVKHQAGRLWWELYFYESLTERAAKVEFVADVVKPWFTIEPRIRESIPYFMFSFDMKPDSTATKTVDCVNLYMPYYQVQGGRSYKVTVDKPFEMDNVYRFYHPKTEIREILHEIKNSVIVDFTRLPVSRVLFPELYECRRICVAKKRYADCVYYSGIDVDALLWFFQRFAYPQPVIDFVTAHKGDLDHLLFDVGIDYTVDAAGEISITKTSYYSTV